jgi:hypothetical protein
LDEISLHILDVAENSLMAGADLVEIDLEQDAPADRLRLRIRDNGRGISPEDLARVTDPFFTTRTTRDVGLGLALLLQTAEQTGGAFAIDSTPGRGTDLSVEFGLSHIDRPPLGDMAGTLVNLIIGRPEVDFVYRQRVVNGQGRGQSPSGDGPEVSEFELDTREIKAALDGVPLSHPEVIDFLRDSVTAGLEDLTDQ